MPLEIDLKLCLHLPAPIILLLLAHALCSAQDNRAESPRDRAFALEEHGQTAEAAAAWQSIVKAHPANAEACAHLGFLAARDRRYRDAIPYYRRALALDPAMPGLRLNLGLALFKAGEMKEAIGDFQPLLKTLPAGSPDALRVTTLIGLAHFGVGEYAEAVPYLKQATGADPQNLAFRLTLAQSCLWSGKYACVLDVYHEILALNAESAEADMLAGEALDEMKDDAGAIEQFRAAVKADPRMPNVHFGLGYLYWRTMKNEQAAGEFQAELAINPDHVQALTYLADTDIRSGHPEAAQPLLARALRLDPRNPLAHLDLGILSANAGRNGDAIREMEMAAKLSPTDANVHWRLGRLYQSAGKKDQAKAEFEKTRLLKKAADASIFHQLKQAQEKGPQPAENPAPPPAQ